jgi:hypothetical protein
MDRQLEYEKWHRILVHSKVGSRCHKIFFDEEKTDRKVVLEMEGVMGNGCDFCSTKKRTF